MGHSTWRLGNKGESIDSNDREVIAIDVANGSTSGTTGQSRRVSATPSMLARATQSKAARTRATGSLHYRAFQTARNSEITKFDDPFLRQKDVGRFDVAVDDA